LDDFILRKPPFCRLHGQMGEVIRHMSYEIFNASSSMSFKLYKHFVGCTCRAEEEMAVETIVSLGKVLAVLLTRSRVVA